MSFRDSIRELSPWWLKRFIGEKYFYAFGAALDGMTEHLFQGATARFAGVGTPTALPYVGRDRVIRRGFLESDASYAARLQRWLLDHKVRGNPFPLIKQLKGYLTPHQLRIRTVDRNGNWFTEEADGTSYFNLAQGNWDWDGAPLTDWSRCWVIIYPPPELWTEGPNIGNAALWSNAIGTVGYTIGTTATPEQVATIRAIVDEWVPEFGRCEWIIVAFDDASFDPTSVPGPPLPDGTWGSISKNVGGVQVPSRLETARYWKGTP